MQQALEQKGKRNLMQHVCCLTVALSVILIMTGLTSCQKDTILTDKPRKVFNAVKFRQAIASQLSGGVSAARGYSMVVNKGGQWIDTFSFGWAYRGSKAVGYTAMSVNQEINIASVTKTLTAVGVLQLINKLPGLSVKSKIGDYLPAYWKAVTAVKDLSFEELMTHSSGLTGSNTDWQTLKTTAATGLDNPAKPARFYANINFALFRAIIPYMLNKTAATAKEKEMVPGKTADFENWLSQTYIDYMQDNVFDPIGIKEATCKASATTAWAFNEFTGGNVDAAVSAVPGDWTNSCGGGGYYLSVMEMARFMAYLSHSYTLLGKDQRSLMDNGLLGWDNGDSKTTIMGQSYGKNGALYWDMNNSGALDTGDAGLQTLIMKFPQGIELSLIVNSVPGNWRSLSAIATSAYNGAWEEK